MRSCYWLIPEVKVKVTQAKLKQMMGHKRIPIGFCCCRLIIEVKAKDSQSQFNKDSRWYYQQAIYQREAVVG